MLKIPILREYLLLKDCWEPFLDVARDLFPVLPMPITNSKEVVWWWFLHIWIQDEIVLVDFVRVIWDHSHSSCKCKLCYYICFCLIHLIFFYWLSPNLCSWLTISDRVSRVLLWPKILCVVRHYSWWRRWVMLLCRVDSRTLFSWGSKWVKNLWIPHLDVSQLFVLHWLLLRWVVSCVSHVIVYLCKQSWGLLVADLLCIGW